MLKTQGLTPVTTEQGLHVADKMGASYIECSSKEMIGVDEIFEQAILTVVANDKSNMDKQHYDNEHDQGDMKIKKRKKRRNCKILQKRFTGQRLDFDEREEHMEAFCGGDETDSQCSIDEYRGVEPNARDVYAHQSSSDERHLNKEGHNHFAEDVVGNIGMYQLPDWTFSDDDMTLYFE